MSIETALESIQNQLAALADKKEEKMVQVPLDHYVEMNKVYEANKDKKYQIELSVHKYVYTGPSYTEAKKISHMHTNAVYFPDDTKTGLTELWEQVAENSNWVKHLEEELGKAMEKIAKQEAEIKRRIETQDQLIEENQVLRMKGPKVGWWKSLWK